MGAPAFDPSQPFETVGAPAFDPSQPFEAVDAAPKSAAPTPPSLLGNEAGDGYVSGVLKGAGTAVVKGLANSVGTIGNLGSFADYLLARSVSAITGRPVQDVLADYAKKRDATGLAHTLDPANVLPSGEDISAPILKRTGEYKPTTELGKMAQSGVEAATSMIGPGGGAAAIERGAASAGPQAGMAALRTAKDLAPVNAVAGAIGQGVTDATDDPLLGMAAGMALPAAGGAAASKIGKTAAAATRPFAEDLPVIGPKFAGQRDQMVGERLRDTAQDPEAFAHSLFPGPRQPGSDEIIPGSQPTTGQLTGDMGILGAERKAITEDNTPFNIRSAEQDAARRAELAKAAPDGDVMKPSRFFQDQLDHIERGTNEAVERLRSGAQQLAARLGPGEAPDALGASIRDPIRSAYDQARKARNALYSAVDPDGSVSIVAKPVRDRVQELAAGLDPYDAPLKPEEARIFGRAQSLPDVMPFKSLNALDKDIYAAMSAERRSAGETPTWGRLSQLKSAVMRAINDAVDNQSAYEQAAVAAGKLDPKNTIQGRLEGLHGQYDGALGSAPRNAGAAAGEDTAVEAAGLSGAGGENGAADFGLGNAARVAAVPGPVSAIAPQGLSGQTLPVHLAGAKPRYNLGQKQYQPDFASDVDKALYITAQASKSARDAEYRAWLNARGYSDREINLLGPKVRSAIKDRAAVSEEGVLPVDRVTPDPAKSQSASINFKTGELRDLPAKVANYIGDKNVKALSDGSLVYVDPQTGNRSKYSSGGLFKSSGEGMEMGSSTPLKTVSDVNRHLGLEAKTPAVEPDLNNHQIFFPGGNLRARYEVVDHPDLVISHDQNFNPNPAFPPELQPRARESAPARDQVNGMASRLQPERLGPSPEANSGAPIIGPDNVVESGNGRALAIGQSYAKGNTAYRDWLQSQGFDTAGMKQPVLVARRTSEMSPAEREYFANSANSASGLKMSASEQASSDAKLVNDKVLDLVADAPVRAAENRDFVRAFAEKLPANERGGILDKNGNLSQTGVRRIEAALAAKAFDDTAFVGRAFDSADSNIRNLAGALVDAAGPWARMRAAAQAGVIDGSHDITHELMDVVRKVMRARDEGRPIADILKQDDMFGSDVVPLVESLLFRDADKGLLASRSRISSGLKTYAVEAEKNLAGPSLFGDELKPGDVFKTALSKAAPDAEEAAPATTGPTFETGASEPIRTVQPNFDQAAADRLNAAKSSHKDLAQTFRNPTIKPVLKTLGGDRDYVQPASAIPAKAVVKGDKGYQAAKAFLKAGKNDPGMVDAMKDRALSPLRSGLKPDGTLIPAKFAKWKQDYAGALKALDEVDPGFSKRFDNAAKASDLLVEASAVAERRLADAQKNVAAGFMKLSTPVEVENKLGTILQSKTGPSQMADLLKRASGDPEVIDGLRKVGIDWMTRKFAATTESGTSGEKQLAKGSFDKFVRDNATTLGALYPADQVNMFRAIARDMDRSSRVLATNVKGGPGTAKDSQPFFRKHFEEAKKHSSVLSAAIAGTLVGFESAGVKGALVGAGMAASAYLLGSLRAAGIKTVDDMFRDALLHPDRARYYLAQIPEASVKADSGPMHALGRAIRRGLILQSTLPR